MRTELPAAGGLEVLHLAGGQIVRVRPRIDNLPGVEERDSGEVVLFQHRVDSGPVGQLPGIEGEQQRSRR